MIRAVTHGASLQAWRAAARVHLAAGDPPATLHFVAEDEAQATLWGSATGAVSATAHPAGDPRTADHAHPAGSGRATDDGASPGRGSGGPPAVPAPFLRLARSVAAHRDPDRFDLLYRLLWRLTHGEPALLHVAVDPDVARAERMAQAVRRDVHKLHAFVRFVPVAAGPDAGDADGRRWVAWARPDHHVLPLGAPHFVRRYPAMPWSILTADASAHWDMARLTFGPGCPQRDVERGDDLGALWMTYYAAIFNPARLKVRAMRQEMPRRYWGTMPETRLIDRLVAEAPMQQQRLIDAVPASATDYLPGEATSLSALRTAAAACAACPWAKDSTQTVFGEGPRDAAVAMVGEQPGDMEDRAGRPFVGPAGELFARALAEAGIDRTGIYVTNAVKHFKFERRGKRRIHQKPSAGDLAACRPWVTHELRAVRPRIVVCLGVSAAQSLLGRAVRLRDVRGTFTATAHCPQTFCTTHPSAILRAPDPARQEADYAAFVADLRVVASRVAAEP